MQHSEHTLRAWDDAHLWHPFTPHNLYRDEDPLIIKEGQGNYLIDINGQRYIDGVASLWCNVLGHRVPEIDQAIRSQLDCIAHGTLLGHATPPAIELAQYLCRLAPKNLCKVFFSDNGSTSVEVALKMACQFWQQHHGGKQRHRQRFLALENAYHGDTLGAVSVGGMDLFHSRFRPLLFDVVRVPFSPTQANIGNESHLHDFERIFLTHAKNLAAVILEPGFQGAAGIVTYPKGYLKRVAELCTEHGVLLILDEVASGMGRSGSLFACAREGITPDLLCIAKGLTGGYLPLAATLATQQIFDAFLGDVTEGRTFFHGHTYTGNALGAAAAIATLKLFERDEVIASLKPKIDCLGQELNTLRALKGVGDVRQYGLAAGIDLVNNGNQRLGMRVCHRARTHGVFLRPLGDTVVIMPPLSIQNEELRQIVTAIRYGIQEELKDAT